MIAIFCINKPQNLSEAYDIVFNYFYPQGFPPGSGGEEACACLGLRMMKLPIAVKAAYLPILVRASFRVI